MPDSESRNWVNEVEDWEVEIFGLLAPFFPIEELLNPL
jgi:hypothetical protein